MPNHLAEINILPELRVTVKDANFLLHDSGAEDVDRIFIFATNSNIDILRGCDVILADATFKVAPHLYCQLWVIYGLYRNTVLPLVYCLMPTKSQQMYSKCLDVVQQFDIAPSTVIIDFEKAEENSCRALFLQSNVHGCFFHFAQAIWRNIQKIVVDDIRWPDRYNDDDDFALDIRQFIALSFVCVDDVIETFEALFDTFNLKYGDDYGTSSYLFLIRYITTRKAALRFRA